MKLNYLLLTNFILLTLCSCNKQSQLMRISEYEELKYNKLDFIIEQDPGLKDSIYSLLQSNNEDDIIFYVISDFIDLQYCEKVSRCFFQDFPNELNTVLDFYKLLDEDQLNWLREPKYSAFRNNVIKFLVLNKEKDYLLHAKEQVLLAKEDHKYLKLIYSASGLY